jgi:hypothetical protein
MLPIADARMKKETDRPHATLSSGRHEHAQALTRSRQLLSERVAMRDQSIARLEPLLEAEGAIVDSSSGAIGSAVNRRSANSCPSLPARQPTDLPRLTRQ